MQVRLRLTTIAAMGSVTALLLGGSLFFAGGSAVASTRTVHPAWTTGREVVRHASKESYAQATKREERLKLRLRGVVNTHGFIDLGGHARVRPIFTRVGRFTLDATSEHIHAKVLSFRFCHLQETVRDRLVVLGKRSTGRFADASGRGRVVVKFRFFFPKKPNGKCNFHAKPFKHGGRISFLLVIPRLTVR